MAVRTARKGRSSEEELKEGRRLWDGARIREIRDDRGQSQEDLAAKSGVSVGDISRHERNDSKSNPSVDSLARLATALDVLPSTLLEPVGAPFPDPRKGNQHDRSRSRGSSEVLERVLEQLDAETPAEDSWRGDVLKAVAALNRALRRGEDSSAAGDAPARARR